MSKVYILCDENNNVMQIRTNMFGKDVLVSAIFPNEQEALDILFEIEVQDLLSRPHIVRGVDSRFEAFHESPN